MCYTPRYCGILVIFAKNIFPRGKDTLQIRRKGLINIVSISRDESVYLGKVAPDVKQVVLNPNAPARKKSRMVENEPNAMKLLDSYRKSKRPVIESYGKRGRR